MEFTTKSGNAAVYADKAEKEDAVRVGVDSDWGSGFVSLPTGKRELLHAASAVGAALLLRSLAGRKRGVKRAQKTVRRRQKQANKAMKRGRR